MRIASLDIVGFRAFGRRQTLDVDADTVIVVGANGQGKTSLFDGALWGITGVIPRLSEDAGSLLSLFSDAGECRVAIGLRGEGDSIYEAVRSYDGTDSRFSFTVDGASSQGPAATTSLLNELWPDALAASNPDKALVAAMETGVYLQQDQVREFIAAHSDEDRFNTIGELVGAGRINELQRQLESSRKAWSTVTNRDKQEVEGLKRRRAQLREQFERLQRSRTATEFDEAAWRDWWSSASQLGLSKRDIPDPGAASSSTQLDAAIKELQAIAQAETRRRQALSALKTAIEEFPSAPEEDVAALTSATEQARAQLEAARAALQSAEGQAAEVRRLQVQATETRAELRALAQLALRHLDEKCPVCDQEYDRERTRERLEAAAAEGAASTEPEGSPPDVASFAKAVQEHEQALSAATRQVSAARQLHEEWHERAERLIAQAEQLGIADTPRENWSAEVERRLASDTSRTQELASLRRRGDEIALALARVGERARLSEIERELGELEKETAKASSDVDRRHATGELLNEIINGLREASSDVVEKRVEGIGPLLQRIYATADPHPAFRVARLVSAMRRGHGRVVPEIKDPIHGAKSDRPEMVLSSSQMNVLAVSVFLALNLGMATLPLDTVILDDPLQSLDDMNLLGLVDLLRRTREHRQVFISTHDRRLAGLLERKLRPVRDGQRTIIVELDGWSREGPKVLHREVERDPSALRVAA